MANTRQATSSARRHYGVTVDAPKRERLRALADAHGVVAAARLVRIGREPFARAVAGLELSRGTAALIDAGLDALDAAVPPESVAGSSSTPPSAA